MFALHRSGLLTEREIEQLADDPAALRRRTSEALTAALDQWADAAGAPFLEARKIPLRVTPPRRRAA